jgi:hypothetical protein
MIVIALVFSGVIYYEWLYLKRNNRKQRTIRIVIGLGCLLMIFMEVVFLFRERLSIAIIIETIFYPLQKIMFAET